MTPGLNLNFDFSFFSPQQSIDSEVDSNAPISSKDSPTVQKDTDLETKDKFENKLNDKKEILEKNDDPKSKKNNFKKKLENLDAAITAMLATVLSNNTTPDQQPTTINQDIQDIETDNYSNIVLSTLNDKLDTQAESLVKEIASIDLSQEGAIQEIIDLSNTLEALNELKAKLSLNSTKIDTSAHDTKLDPDLDLLLESRIDDFIDSYVESKQSNESQNTDTTTELDLLVEELNAEITSNSADNGSQESHEDHNLSDNSPDNFILDKTSFVNLQQTPGNSKTVMIKETVNINKLDSFILDRVTQISNNKKETLDITLTPGDLGKVQISITRHNDKLEIQMHFSSQESMDSVEHKLNELQHSLKAKGFDAEIKVSAENSSSNANNSNQGQQPGSFNEARDEQKEKILNTAPAWLKNTDSNHTASFAEALEGIID